MKKAIVGFAAVGATVGLLFAARRAGQEMREHAKQMKAHCEQMAAHCNCMQRAARSEEREMVGTT